MGWLPWPCPWAVHRWRYGPWTARSGGSPPRRVIRSGGFGASGPLAALDDEKISDEEQEDRTFEQGIADVERTPLEDFPHEIRGHDRYQQRRGKRLDDDYSAIGSRPISIFADLPDEARQGLYEQMGERRKQDQLDGL